MAIWEGLKKHPVQIYATVFTIFIIVLFHELIHSSLYMGQAALATSHAQNTAAYQSQVKVRENAGNKKKSTDTSWQSFTYLKDIGLYMYKEAAIATVDQNGEPSVMISCLWRHGSFTSVRSLSLVCVLNSTHAGDVEVKATVYQLDFVKTRSVYPVWPIMVHCSVPKGEKITNFTHVRVAQIPYQSRQSARGNSHTLRIKSPAIDIEQKRIIDTKGRIGMCVKYHSNLHSAYWVAEWMEYHKALGVTQVIMYDYADVSPAVDRLLRHYQAAGFLRIQPWKNSFSYSRFPDDGEIYVHGQFTINNDCLYRFGGKFEYLIYVDLDEIIVPSNFLTYHDMIQNLLQDIPIKSRHKVASFLFQMVVHCMPVYPPHSQEQLLLTKKFPNHDIPHGYRLQTKFLVRPSLVFHVGVHSAYVYRRPKSQIKVIRLRPETALLHHYRGDPNYNCTVRDLATKPYFDIVGRNVKHALWATSTDP